MREQLQNFRGEEHKIGEAEETNRDGKGRVQKKLKGKRRRHTN
jgi:hypothetical protein